MGRQRISGIYKIISPSGRVYIGQSKDCLDRIKRYKRLDCYLQGKLYNSLKKYGWDAHSFEIIRECEPDELNFWEKFYIELFQTFNSVHGLNLVLGAASIGARSDETKEKNRVATKQLYESGEKQKPVGEKNGMFGNGHKLSGEKNGRFGKPVSTETREKIRQGNFLFRKKCSQAGIVFKHSEESKRKLSEAKKGTIRNVGSKRTEETKARQSEAARKRFSQETEQQRIDRIKSIKRTKTEEYKKRQSDVLKLYWERKKNLNKTA